MTERYDLRLGDSREVLKTLAENSVDSVVTDPPYALESIVKRFGKTSVTDETKTSNRSLTGSDGFGRLARGFMGQVWDTGETAFSAEFWAEILRVLKPGGHLLAFSSTRTQHRMVCAIEDAGFEIRDQCMWVYGSGMAKSHNQGDGVGTAVKPAWEPICVARKPLIGTVRENIDAWGTGGLNIDACRVGTGDGGNRDGEKSAGARYEAAGVTSFARTPGPRGGDARGRFPANLIHDGSPEVLALFPANAGASAPVRGTEPSSSTTHIYSERTRVLGAFHADVGSAARFFYCAKASKADREEGCESLPDGVLAMGNGAQTKAAAGDVVDQAAGGIKAARRRKNHHPTVKPTDLMRYLCRLVTPPGGTVLDPFMGSGSTGKAAMMEGLRFIGIEREPAYMEIATARVISGVTAVEKPRVTVKSKAKPVPQNSAQSSLFEAAA